MVPPAPTGPTEQSRLLLAAARGGAGDLDEIAGRLRTIDPATIDGDPARIAFWLNVYNARLLDALGREQRNGHLFRHRRLFRTGGYEVGAHTYTLDVIEHGLLRGNARRPYSPRRTLPRRDPRLAAAPSSPDPRIHFALNCGARSCPPVRAYSGESLDSELSAATTAYMAAESRLDREAGKLELPGLLKLYRADFGSREQLISLAATALGADDGRWITMHGKDLKLVFAAFDWQLQA